MGRRRRRVIRIVKKKLPTVFVCPRCGEEAVRVTIAKDTGKATVLCALCNLKDEFPAHPAAQPIDVYSYFTDRFYGVKDARPIIPHEREISQGLAEEEPVDEEVAPPESPTSETVQETPALNPQVEEPKLAPKSTVTEPVQQTEAAVSSTAEQTPAEAPEASPEEEARKEPEEENEPFADILENKDKKRYSPNPLPQQSSEQTS